MSKKTEIHLADQRVEDGWIALCSVAVTNEPDHVTCPDCLERIAAAERRAQPEEAPDGDE